MPASAVLVAASASLPFHFSSKAIAALPAFSMSLTKAVDAAEG